MRDILIAAACVAALASAASAADLRVGAGQKYRTIQAAVNAAAAGDRILVGRGVYSENVTSALDGLKFVGSKGAVWDGNVGAAAGVCLSANGKNVVVQGFAFRNGSSHVVISGDGARVAKCTSSGASGAAVRIEGAAARVESCAFVGAGGDTVMIGGANATARANKIDGAGGDGIRVSGDGAVVDANAVRGASSASIDVEGAGAKVTKNVCSVCQSTAIEVYGTGALVQGNRASNVADYGIDVSGDGAKVTSNKVSNSVGTGIYVYGDVVTVRANRVDVTVDDADGIAVYSRSAGGGFVENNTVNDAHQNGFNLSTKKATIRGNKATRCGTENEVGFSLYGDDNVLSGNVAKDGDSYGFRVSGDRNAVAACTATGNTQHGFSVTSGADNVFASCTATGNDGDGFQNLAQTTDLVGGTFRNNRVDVTNAGTFDRYQGVKLGTGGKDTAPDF